METNQDGPQPLASTLHNAIKAISEREPVPMSQYRERELKQREAATEKARRDSTLRTLVTDAGGSRYLGYKFDNWEAKNDKQRAVKFAAQEWSATVKERLTERNGLILWGPIGTGKDHLAFAAVACAVSEAGIAARWKNGRDLFGSIRDRISKDQDEGDLIASLESPQVLVISDPLPPVGQLTQHQADMLYRIIENRYAAGRITVLTVNVTSDQEADARIGAPTWDRLCDGAWKLHCNWASHRKPAKEVK